MPRAKYLPKHWHDEDELHTDIRCLIKRMMTHAKECHRTVVYFANLITVLLVYEVEHELLIFLNQTTQTFASYHLPKHDRHACQPSIHSTSFKAYQNFRKASLISKQHAMPLPAHPYFFKKSPVGLAFSELIIALLCSVLFQTVVQSVFAPNIQWSL